ncbi:MAG: rhomboid family intramembrane serine protease [Deltaproteobacteria bacterium]|nr:rhomboid family intramembrane serine protease [Deltaproteobacteria bacterium]
MIPVKDDNPTRSFPFFTISIIALNILIFIYQISLGRDTDKFILQMALIPYEIIHFTKIHSLSAIPPPATFFTSIFTHANLLHLGGNMLYLWIFGNNIEDALGHVRFLVFYFTCGILATACHIAIDPNSTVPLVGASGAIAGVLGAYLLIYPRAGVHTLVFIVFFIRIIRLPAAFVLSLWFIIQLVNSGIPGGGVAWFAHIGGFVGGFILVKPFMRKKKRKRK